MNFEEIILKIDPENDYKVVEISKLLGMSYSCILAHVRRGNIKSKKVFSRIYIKGRDIRNYLIGEK